MSDTNSKNDVLDFAGDTPQKLPSGLNVITILTIVGSILGFISSIWGFFSAQKTYETMKQTIEGGDLEKVPGFMKGMVNAESLGMYQKMAENKLPILILGLVASALCLYGALEMRKRKKQGYIFWLIGEILPIITLVLFVGMIAFNGFGLIGLLFPAIFIILYTVNKKELIY